MQHDRNDPIFAALAKWKSVDREFQIWRGQYKAVEQSHRQSGVLGTDDSNRLLMTLEEESEPLLARRNEVLQELYDTKPSTLKGLAALVQVFISEDLVEAEGLAGSAITTICDSIVSLTEAPQ